MDLFNPEWQQAPTRPRLGPGEVHVWRLDLGRTGLPDRPAARTLAHRARNRILASYLDLAPGQLSFAHRPGGKPYLDIAQPAPAFNLSHSRGVGLLAVALGREVGIDVEKRRPINDPLRLARRVMSKEDIAQLTALHGAARLEQFFVLWTLFEARQKALGHGIFAPAAESASLYCQAFACAADTYGSLAVTQTSDSVEVSFFDGSAP